MSIRFFATNRDQDQLGRDLKRDTRLKLQTGGYYWIDTRGYMAHYLSTTDPSKMPASTIFTNSEAEVFKVFLNKPAVKRVIIGIHGFNVPLQGAITSFSLLADMLKQTKKLGPTIVTDPVLNIKRNAQTRQIEEVITDWRHLSNSDSSEPLEQILKNSVIWRKVKDLEHVNSLDELKQKQFNRLDDPDGDVTAFVGFSWPSNGKVLDYQFDRTEAVSSAPILGNLISRIRTQNPRLKVHVISHSMGNYLTCHMLAGLVNKVTVPLVEEGKSDEKINAQISRRDQGGDDNFFIDRYIMLAPDVERRAVTQCDVDAIPGTPAEYLGPFYAGLYHLVEEIHLFYSGFDTALQASVTEKEARETLEKVKTFLSGPNLENRWESSLGLNPLPPLAPPNMYDHNGVTLTDRKLDHGDYFDALAIGERISEIIMSSKV
ncbi:MAG: alpha/beta hydrolase [Oculatellaceae cyanobacterium bins.114]|nr:alpha/beta hydrolase [Oculatellaceae cyanobacterium bins.114]